jgi:hypothetical protein
LHEEEVFLASKQGGTAGTPVPYEIVDFMRDGSFFIYIAEKGFT